MTPRGVRPVRRAVSPASPAQRRKGKLPPKKGVPGIRKRRGEWADGARSSSCAVCGKRPHEATIRGHHILRQQVIRRLAVELGLGYEELRWDPRNRLPICDQDHADHHSGKRRIALDSLPAEAFGFAAELDGHFPDGREPALCALEREYAAGRVTGKAA